ncbi:hypothetical protein BV509_15485 [Rhodovulum sulfidophilum]|uniref:Uncharacterized protein n=1 Tax=Rhodovulum visakhapatnamense TaxID=364297 RepID=A0ABS1RHY1_9RHOB|nr:hypothetical protein [Rhodovulum visakhapatnamense]MBL3568521.1 hypothetical protein [Rhodovulum visakhapatnamense]MBL3579281.1 hypothetical protein [Rhodovulum visakhapatnamense]OLS45607.1 hypothetical protein BV509_15485 [Rhodovulum sulfidophilum]
MRLVGFQVAVLAVLLAGPALAEPALLKVDFGFFPKGTTCQPYGTGGKVTMKEGREIRFKIKGDTGHVSFRCKQPDGRSFEVQTGRLLPPGSPSMVAVQINQDDHAHVLWDDGGLRKTVVADVLKWK